MDQNHITTPSSLQEVETTTEGLKVFPGKTGRNYIATLDGFLFIPHSNGNNKRILRCYKHNEGCHARLHLSLQWKSVVSKEKAGLNSHMHDPEDSECRRRYFTWKLKTMAKSTNESTNSVIASALEVIPVDLQGGLQQDRSMKRVVQRSRCPELTQQMAAKTREELPILYNQFKATDEDFVKWDSADTGTTAGRTVIFSTARNLQWLQYSDHWFCDGTFKCQPLLFDQLFVISGLRGEGYASSCFPLVFCLTPNRTMSTYAKILEKLKDIQPGLAPISVMTDFEKASLGAFSTSFPDATQRGCFFHFRQANLRHIKKYPALREQLSDATFSLHIKMLTALAFVPPADVVATYEEFETSPFVEENKELLEEYLDYFCRTWLGAFNRRGIRQPPMFSIHLWNCRDSVTNDLHKTNNFSEGFNRGFLSLLSVHHPTLPKFVSGLLKQVKLTSLKMEKYTSNVPPSPGLSHKHNLSRLKSAVLKFKKLLAVYQII